MASDLCACTSKPVPAGRAPDPPVPSFLLGVQKALTPISGSDIKLDGVCTQQILAIIDTPDCKARVLSNVP